MPPPLGFEPATAGTPFVLWADQAAPDAEAALISVGDLLAGSMWDDLVLGEIATALLGLGEWLETGVRPSWPMVP